MVKKIKIFSYPPLLSTARAIIIKEIKAVEAGKFTLRVPALRNQWQVVPGMPFHPTPILFFQLSGTTIFNFPGRRFQLRPGQTCLVPPGIPSLENVTNLPGHFCNLVFSFRKQFMCFHIAHEYPPGRPEVLKGFKIEYPHTKRIIEYLVDTAEAYHQHPKERHHLLKGVYLAALSHILAVLKKKHLPRHDQPFKVLQARQYILDHFTDPMLCVKQIADWVHCTPDYLSFLFHKETGLSLSGFINEQRLSRARLLLGKSTSNVAETARTVGFTDPGYFTRLFHKATGLTPTAYRKNLCDSILKQRQEGMVERKP